jgi:hypothetical protein
MFRRSRSHHQVSVNMYTEHKRLQVVSTKHYEEDAAHLIGIKAYMSGFL